MANQQHLDILKQGVDVWNKWRQKHPTVQPILTGANLENANLEKINLGDALLARANLSGANLINANLSRANLTDANLSDPNFAKAQPYDMLQKTNLSGADLHESTLDGANLSGVILSKANLSGAKLGGAFLNNAILNECNLSRATLWFANLNTADLRGAEIKGADLRGADLRGANLQGANLSEADLSGANFNKAICNGANFSKAKLHYATLVETDLERADLTGCFIYGISAWNVHLKDANQINLIITPDHEPTITVDNLEVAQFIYLLLNNKKIREVIDTITSKVVLILGRFTDERKAVLDAIRDELRKHDKLPVMFDFERTNSRNLTETISTLAHMSRFIIADLTDPKSIPQELERIVPRLRVPIQPLLHTSEYKPYSMFEDFEDYSWVLPIYHYTDQASLLQSLKENVIDPAERKTQELIKRRIKYDKRYS